MKKITIIIVSICLFSQLNITFGELINTEGNSSNKNVEIYKSSISDLNSNCTKESIKKDGGLTLNSCFQNTNIPKILDNFLLLLKSKKIDEAVSQIKSNPNSFNFNIEGITVIKTYKKYNNGILFIDFFNGGGEKNIDMYQIGYIKAFGDDIFVYKNSGLFGQNTEQYKDYIKLYGLGGYSSYNPNGYGWNQEFENDIIKAFLNGKFNNKNTQNTFSKIISEIDLIFGNGNPQDNIKRNTTKLLILSEKQKNSIEKAISKLNKEKLEKLIIKIDAIISQKKNLSEKQKNIYQDVKTIIYGNALFIENKTEDINNKSFGKNFKSENGISEKGIIFFFDSQMNTWLETDIDIDSFELFDDYYGKDKYGFFNGNLRINGGTKDMWYKGKGLFIDNIKNKLYSVGFDYKTLQELYEVYDANSYEFDDNMGNNSNKCNLYKDETLYDSYDNKYCYLWTSRIDLKKVGTVK